MASEPLASHRRTGFSLTVYPNRIEVEERGLMALRKTQTVLLRNIAGVDLPRTKAHIVVKTNDGKRYKWVCGGDTETIYQAIMAAL